MLKTNLTGQTIGQWKILGFSYRKYKQGNVIGWDCQCVCGNTRWKRPYDLKDPQQQRCSSCASPERNKKRIKYSKPFEPLFQRLLLAANYRGLECSLTYEDFYVFTNTKECAYCGVDVVWSLSSQAMATNLDRMDNSKGYEKNNCTVCCLKCNRIKRDYFTYAQMLEVGALIKKWRLSGGNQGNEVQANSTTQQETGQGVH